jgi:hypothetical protein
MIDITHLREVPLPLFNELEEVRVWPHMGPLMYDCLTSPEKVNSMFFHVYRV